MTAILDDATADPWQIVADLQRKLDASTAELAQRNSEYGERIEQQSATIDVLKVMSASPGDPQPVFDLIVSRAQELCNGWGVTLCEFDGHLVRLSALCGKWEPSAVAAYQAAHPLVPTRASITCRAILDRQVVHIRDIDAVPELLQVMRNIGWKSNLALPLLRDGVAIGAISLTSELPGGFSDSQVALLQTFAEQAVIAIRNAETYRELRQRTGDLQEALEYQTATSDVLKVISRSTFHLQPVLDTLAETAARLCDAGYSAIFRRDGEVYRIAAVIAFSPETMDAARKFQAFLEQHPLVPGRGSITGRVAVEGRSVHVADTASDPEYTLSGATTLGNLRTQLGVPLLREGEPVGVIVVARQRVEPFTERQVELVHTFADQAVIAMENARLITETREALEQQTATAEVLQVINSSPGELQPVFQAILERAHSLCGVSYGSLQLYDGEKFRAVAVHGLSGALADRLRQGYSPGATNPVRRLVDGERFVHTPDLAEIDDPMAKSIVELGATRTLLWVALRKDEKLLGLIAAARLEVRPFSDKHIALLENFAAQAVIAMENARLITETREALEQQTATAEVLQVINSSPGDLAPVFEAMLERATRLCEATHGHVWKFDGEQLHAVAVHGDSPFVEWLRQHGPVRPIPGSAADRIARGEGFVHMADRREEDAYRDDPIFRGLVDTSGVRASLSVALRKDETLLGMINVYRQEVRPFSDQQIALLENFAAQAVIAIDNARLITETREALEQQTATAEVLQVINSSPGDLKPVFDAMVGKALDLCGAAYGYMYTYDGERVHPAAMSGEPRFQSWWREQGSRVPDPGSPLERALRGEPVVHVADVRQEEVYGTSPVFKELVDLGGIRTGVIVALRKDNTSLGTIHVFRREVRPFSQKQLTLLETFAAQAVIAMDNARLITETREALERQTATAEVLQVINSSPGDLTPVFDAMLDKAMRLCGAAFGFMTAIDGEQTRTVAARGVPAAYAAFRERNPTPANAPIASRVRKGEPFIHIVDLKAERFYGEGDPQRRAIVDLGGARTLLAVPLMRDQAVLGAIQVYRTEVRPFSEKQITLLQNFAAQAVIAMENVRLITETREALEQQTATAEVLQVINSSPGDLAPVFDAILDKAQRVCGVDHAALELYDGQRFYAVAVHGASDKFAETLRHGYRATDSPAGRAMLEGQRFAQIADAAQIDHIAFRTASEVDGIRTVLFVPLRRDDTLLGMIASARREVRPFSEKEIALLENFAAQAVIAMENARLLTETREALEQQTATAEILQVINSSPGDLQPVFDAMLDKALGLCGADFGVLWTYDGERIHATALRGVPPTFAKFLTRTSHSVGPDNAHGRLLRGEPVVHIADVAEDKAYSSGDPIRRTLVELGGGHTLLAVPLRKDDTFLGDFVIYRQEVRAFSDKQIALLQNFAAQAVIAIENARLLDEIRQRQAELRVTFDNMADGVVMFDEDLRLAAWNRNFQQILDLPDALLIERPSYAEYLRILANRGEFGTDDIEAELSRRLEDTDQELRFERTRPDGRVIEVRRNSVPDGGFVLIYSDITERKRSEAEIHAARDAAEAAYRDLKAAQANLIQAEKMASLGQLTAGIAHEIKNPLNFVNNFAGLSVELLDELKETAAPAITALDEDKRAEVDETIEMLTGNLEKIAEHGRRADGIVRSMLEHSRGSSGERRSVDLNGLIEEALNLAYHGARAQDQSFNITLERDFAHDITPIELVPQDITRVCLNLFSNGFYAATKRQKEGDDPKFQPTLKVTTRDLGNVVEIRVRDNGIGILPEIKDKLFQPFFTTKPTGEGTGLGLSISYDVVTQQHGGTITVDSRVGEFTEFTVRLPRRYRAAIEEAAS